MPIDHLDNEDKNVAIEEAHKILDTYLNDLSIDELEVICQVVGTTTDSSDDDESFKDREAEFKKALKDKGLKNVSQLLKIISALGLKSAREHLLDRLKRASNEHEKKELRSLPPELQEQARKLGQRIAKDIQMLEEDSHHKDTTKQVVRKLSGADPATDPSQQDHKPDQPGHSR